MTAPRDRDSIVPGSARLVIVHDEYTVVTVQCGGCGGRQETRSTVKTTRCKGCGRACRVAPIADDPNVIPLRRTA